MKNKLILAIILLGFGCNESKVGWEYVEKVMIDGCDPVGIVAMPEGLKVSCKSQNKILTIDDSGYTTSTSVDYKEPVYLNKSGKSILVPEFNLKTISRMNERDMFRIPIVEPLVNPTSALEFPGILLVVDYNGHRVVYYKGKSNLTFGEYGTGNGQFNYPKDIAVLGDHIYVSDSGNKRIQMFDSNGKFVRTYGADLGLKSCDGICVTKNFIGLTDAVGNMVVLLDHDGNVIQKFEEQFEFPSDLILTKDEIVVTNTNGGFLSIIKRR